MTSVILNRRALLGSGALVGLGPCLQRAASKPPTRRARRLQHLRHLRQALLHLLFAATRADPRHPMESTERPTNTAQPRTYRNPASPKKATTKSL